METKQALQIIKEILDAASKSGLFQNLDSSIVAANAFKVIESKLNED
jgi:hypothetical protein